LQGSAKFLKRRGYEWYTDGIAAGLEPVTWNPIEMMLMKGAEMRRYYEFHRNLNELAARGDRVFVKLGDDAPENFVTVRDKAFEVWAPPVTGLREAFDAGLREGLETFAKDNGIDLERKVSIGKGKGRAWGYSVSNANTIVTRFGGPDFVYPHEIGHAIEDQHHFLAAVTTDPNPLIGKALEDQINALADARFGHDPNAARSFRQYVREDDEKAAVIVQAYVSARDLFAKLAPDVLDRFEQFIAARPKLAPLADIRPTLTLGSDKAEKQIAGPQLVGHYYLPAEAARLYENMLAPSLLSKSAIVRGVFGANSFFTALNLGFSAFHLTGSLIRSMATEFDRALVGLTRGRLLTAAGGVFAPLAPVLHYDLGRKLIKAWYKPDGVDPMTLRILDALRSGGFRPKMSTAFRSQAGQQIRRAWRQAIGQAKEGTKGAAAAAVANASLRTVQKSFPALMQAANWLTMEHGVPHLKSGAAYMLMVQELNKLGPNATQDQVREAARRVVDLSDERYGLLVYDNLLIPRWIKETMMMSQRAVGWNVGTGRAYAGAALETATMPRRILDAATGNAKPEAEGVLTHRQAYAVGMFGLVGLAGALLTYLMTGHRPKELKDYYYPPTGEVDEHGRPIRLSLPTELRDVIGFMQRPGQTITNKRSPLISIAGGILSNKDFWNEQVRDPESSRWQQTKDVAKFIGKQMLPISYTSEERLKEQGASPGKRALSFAGIQEAPRRESLTKAEQLAKDILERTRAQGGMSRQEADRVRAKIAILHTLRTGDEKATEAAMQQAVNDGLLSQREAINLAKHSHENPLAMQVASSNVTVIEAIRIWNAATPIEREDIRQAVAHKIIHDPRLTPEQKDGFLRRTFPEEFQPAKKAG
jgi:hypothetical protein